MAINQSALSSKFQVPTLKQQEEKAAFRRWQAVFYTVRFLQWDQVKKQIFREALEFGTLSEYAPGEYDPDEIKQLYAEAWEEFKTEFDAGFIQATLEELVAYAQQHFGTSLEDLLELNAQRSATRFSR
jgi:hypothetical protein